MSNDLPNLVDKSPPYLETGADTQGSYWNVMMTSFVTASVSTATGPCRPALSIAAISSFVKGARLLEMS